MYGLWETTILGKNWSYLIRHMDWRYLKFWVLREMDSAWANCAVIPGEVLATHAMHVDAVLYRSGIRLHAAPRVLELLLAYSCLFNCFTIARRESGKEDQTLLIVLENGKLPPWMMPCELHWVSSPSCRLARLYRLRNHIVLPWFCSPNINHRFPGHAVCSHRIIFSFGVDLNHIHLVSPLWLTLCWSVMDSFTVQSLGSTS